MVLSYKIFCKKFYSLYESFFGNKNPRLVEWGFWFYLLDERIRGVAWEYFKNMFGINVFFMKKLLTSLYQNKHYVEKS